MSVSPVADFASSIRYALSHRLLPDGRAEIVLDLFRGSVPALTRTVARVTDAELGPVTLKCRAYLDRRGAHAVANSAERAYDRDSGPDAFGVSDWMFAS